MRRVGGQALLATVVVGVGLVLAAVLGSGRWAAPEVTDLDLGAAGADAADGTWVVAEIVRDDHRVDVAEGTAPVLALDTASAVVTGDAGCNPLLGSFTLRPSGEASFTVPSARQRRCDPAAQAQEEELLAALEGVSTWHVDDDRLVLSGAGSRLVLSPFDP